MSSITEIQNLQNLVSNFEIKIEVKELTFVLSKVKLSVQNKSHTILIQDEYNDLKHNNPLLNLCLVLRELEIYKESSDFLEWCKAQNVNGSNEELRQYYLDLSNIYLSIENVIGVIDSQISDLDFQLNAGAVKALRNSNFED